MVDYLIEFVRINAVNTTSEPGCYVCNITQAIQGAEEDVDYCLRSDDPYGIAPQVWTALEAWLIEDKPVGPDAW